MRNLSIYEPQIEKQYAFKKTCMMLPNITTPICLDITLYIVLANQLVIPKYLKRKVQEMVSNFKLLLFTIFIMTMQVLDF